jgi:carbamoyl-phosphate synthase small subunit
VGITTGEIAFNTAMTGYQEVFTDPSYYGQVLVMATSHIGNYGVKSDEIESENCKVAGVIIKKFSDVASRIGGNGTLQDYLVRDNVVGICDIDTRSLVRHIRQAGAMNCIIAANAAKAEFTDAEITDLKAKLKAVPSMDGLELSSKVAATESFYFGNPDAELKVAVLDFGIKKNILRCLDERGAYCKVFPLHATKEEILVCAKIVVANYTNISSIVGHKRSRVSKCMQSDCTIFDHQVNTGYIGGCSTNSQVAVNDNVASSIDVFGYTKAAGYNYSASC